MLVTNFASFQNLGEGKNNVLGFEIKPKSCVTEKVPSAVIQHVTKNSDRLKKFLSKQIATRFLNHQITKFEVLQVSRMYSGKLKEISLYDPHKFFDLNDPDSTANALRELMSNFSQIYAKMYLNGVKINDITDDNIKMIANFLKQSGIISALYKYQHFSLHSLEYIFNLYQLVQHELEEPSTRDKHFEIITEYFRTFKFDTHYILSNKVYDFTKQPDFKEIWEIILGYLISATVKDFTIMMRIGKADETSSKQEEGDVMEWKGQSFKVRIGVIDLDSKMYSKIPSYIKESQQDYMNFVNFHNL